VRKGRGCVKSGNRKEDFGQGAVVGVGMSIKGLREDLLTGDSERGGEAYQNRTLGELTWGQEGGLREETSRPAKVEGPFRKKNLKKAKKGCEPLKDGWTVGPCLRNSVQQTTREKGD